MCFLAYMNVAYLQLLASFNAFSLQVEKESELPKVLKGQGDQFYVGITEVQRFYTSLIVMASLKESWELQFVVCADRSVSYPYLPSQYTASQGC